MSAWLVSSRHISTLATYAVSRGFIRPEAFQLACETLRDENIRSLACRYGHNSIREEKKTAAAYAFEPVRLRDHYNRVPLATYILKAIQCYAYQACECDDWETQAAAIFVAALERQARAEGGTDEGALYNRAPWGIDEDPAEEAEKVARRAEVLKGGNLSAARNPHHTEPSRKRKPSPNGVVLYRGPSMLNGAPIVVIATGLNASSENSKTGSMVQVWILPAEIDPWAAVQQGTDDSVCGSCIHRGRMEDGRNVKRSCYVRVSQAPLSVWNAWQRGIYPEFTPDQAAELFRGRRVRIGAYGDPGAVPFWLWSAVLAYVDASTGYTHQWRVVPAEFSRYCMASCDTVADQLEASALGYRTFRVRQAGDATLAREVVCPASKEAGVKTSCALCVACGGTSAKARVNIVINVHGSPALVQAYNAALSPAS